VVVGERAVREDGRRRREAIVMKAVELASLDGVQGLTIGHLAAELEMSKSGVYAHFGSKQELQLATIARASVLFTDRVIEPAAAQPPGLGRVIAFCDSFLRYVRRGDLPGGCFFASATLELGGRPGPVKQAVAEHQRSTWTLLYSYLAEAVGTGDLAESEDLQHLMLELQGILLAANSRYVVEDDDGVLTLAASVVRRRLGVPDGWTPRRVTPD
jgi:AcrR family transcriptional regulator